MLHALPYSCYMLHVACFMLPAMGWCAGNESATLYISSYTQCIHKHMATILIKHLGKASSCAISCYLL